MTRSTAQLPPASLVPRAKLPDKKQSRGGALRVGRVVSEVRNNRLNDDEYPPNQVSSVSLLRDDEKRIQQDMIEMLTAKLAKKERENELYRVQQQSLDSMRENFENELQQLRAATDRTIAELEDAKQELQRQLQLLQMQFDRTKEESEARNVVAQESKRLREKELAASRTRDFERQATIEQLELDLQRSYADRSALEMKLVAALNQHQASSDQIIQLEAKTLALEEHLHAEQQTRVHLESQVAASAVTLEQEQRARANVELQLQRVNAEKQSLEEKLRLLSKSVKDASAKAADADKKRQQLTKSEDDLALQIKQLRKENEELKARRGQMSSQTKHLSARVAMLEKSDASLQQKLSDALTEIESARKCSREYQFRIKQLQEELVFVEKRKRAADAVLPAALAGVATDTQLPTIDAAVSTTSPPVAADTFDTRSSQPETTSPAAVAGESGGSNDEAAIPSWMKD